MEPSSSSTPSSVITAEERRRRSAEDGRALIAAWQASGLSMRAFAQQRGVRTQRLSYWRLRLRDRAQASASESAFVQVSPVAPAPAVAGLVVELPSGIRVRVGTERDLPLLRAVVAALGSC